MPAIGKNQRKILLLLQTGAALALSASPRTSFRILNLAVKEWKKINKYALCESIRRLHSSKLIDARDAPDGSTNIILNEDGKRKCLQYKIDEMEIKKPKIWDQKWRVILFDVPEERRKIRDALRNHLRQLGCYEFQKSVFVHPFECKDEIDFLIEFYHARPFVRFITAEHVDNALHLKQKFHI